MPKRSLPWFGWLGLLVMGLGQLLTVWHWRPLSDYWYGLCWTGFSLLADAWVYRRTGRCLLRNRRLDVLLMLVVSALTWWGLEIANQSMQTWEYSASHDIPLWRQRLRSTFFFATLIPATWSTGLAALALGDWSWLNERRTFKLGVMPRVTLVCVGLACLVLSPWFIELALGLLLLGLVLLLDPINHWRNRPSLLSHLERGDYRVPALFALGTMAMGVIGEMWNYPAAPKWTYDVPYIGFAYVFEMPLLGFFGYGLLALSIFVVYHFARGFLLAPSACDDDILALTGL